MIYSLSHYFFMLALKTTSFIGPDKDRLNVFMPQSGFLYHI